MKRHAKHTERIETVRRIFEEHDFGNVELLESWEGVDLDELADNLTEEEFQILLDELEELEEDKGP